MSFVPADYWPPGPPTGGAALDQVARDAAAAAQSTANAAVSTGAELVPLLSDPTAAYAPATPTGARAFPTPAKLPPSQQLSYGVNLASFRPLKAPLGDGVGKTVIELAADGLYPTYAATKAQTATLLGQIQADYKRVATLNDTMDFAVLSQYTDWVRAHARQSLSVGTNAAPTLVIPPGLKLMLNRPWFLGCDRSGPVGHYVDGTPGTRPGDAGYLGDPLAFILLVRGNGSVIYSTAAGASAVDLSGGRFTTVYDLTVIADPTTPPECAFLLARGGYIGADPTTGVSADEFTLVNCRAYGPFTVCGFYNFASENSYYLFCYAEITGSSAIAAAIYSRSNAEGMHMPYQTKVPAGDQGTAVKFYEAHCKWYYNVTAATAGVAATRILSGVVRFHSVEAFCNQVSGPLTGVPHNRITGSDAAHPCADLIFDGDHHHGIYSDGIVVDVSCSSLILRGSKENAPGRSGATLALGNNIQIADSECISAESIVALGASGGILRSRVYLKGSAATLTIAGSLTGVLETAISTETVGVRGYQKINTASGVSNVNSLQSYSNPIVASSGASLTPALSTTGKYYSHTATAAFTVNLPGSQQGGSEFIIEIVQGGAGGFAGTWNAGYKFNTPWSDAGNVTGARVVTKWLLVATNVLKQIGSGQIYT